MQPVAAVSLVFTIVLGAVLWVQVLRLSIAESTGLAVLAILFPPIPLALFVISSRHRQKVLPLVLLVAGLSSIAAIYS
ncbi:hypothetical protein [Microbulbifer hydrolyticus]|uniref:Uncharacterized membrane protein (UPF0136 family) n=1 Tax=Microbulbifer hydrolyticus TaxID=48074 RepID=A0A6P1T7L3_9GAMM|nr:hypothetical protein [Microbulbifer hydrolyticus]MBB5211605.1 uncharacterized membrane protein (UPF0136 family) [Microbulbifer hydrolyticus]QHQ37660.1 hypothetical protein GTQ55_00790 [Microbulbifer hydrolyticus]